MKIQKKKLQRLLPELDVRVFEEASSTNTLAKSEEVYTLIVANSQTDGRGRNGKSFFSPTGGVYMSLVLPDTDLATIRTAVAVTRSLERYSPDDAFLVKWVNDIFSNGKKVSGILAEKVGDRIVMGVGVNINRRDFPDDIKDIAGAATVKASREELIADIAKEIILCRDIPAYAVLEEYKSRLFMLGKQIEYVKNGEKHGGIAKGITADGNLIVSENGRDDILNSGEISLSSENFIN